MLAAVFAVVLLALAPAADPWTAAQLLQPAALAARLADPSAPKPVILYVGPSVLYRSKHIPGALFAGPTATAAGMVAFRQAAAKHRRGQEIVPYCGCCPWAQCPNIRPAFQALREMGFTNPRLLALPTSFYKDWIEKGYPIEKGLP
jgi:3-mercaptopyruvate sulfurtransferase SseA